MTRRRTELWAGLALVACLATRAEAQQLDLTKGGPIDVTATDGIDWQQNEKKIIARGNAKAVRENVTVTADRLIAYYRRKPGAPEAGAKPTAAASTPSQGAPAAAGGIGGGDTETSGNEVYRVEAEGHVNIFTPTDHAEGDHAVYDLDQAVMVMTGMNLKLTTPQDVLTARDTLEYWAQRHMAVARGNAVVVTNDGRRIAADTLVAYTTDTPQAEAHQQPVRAAARTDGKAEDPLTSSGKLQKVDAIGNVSIRTATETVTGDRGVYVPDTGIARLGGHVRITRGQNQLNGAEAEVNLKTGISTLLSGSAGRVQGLVVPNDANAPGGTQADQAKTPKGKQP
jgi:lipopolysaccharide export system protein LptA